MIVAVAMAQAARPILDLVPVLVGAVPAAMALFVATAADAKGLVPLRDAPGFLVMAAILVLAFDL